MMHVTPGTVFIAPFPGVTGEAAKYVDSITFMSLDHGCNYILVLDAGITHYTVGEVIEMTWDPEHWLDRGWSTIED